MRNLLGDVWAGGTPDWSRLLELPGLRLHLYGKSEPRVGRKMGHYCVLAETLDEAREIDVQAQKILGVSRQVILERTGIGAWREIDAHLPSLETPRFPGKDGCAMPYVLSACPRLIGRIASGRVGCTATVSSAKGAISAQQGDQQGLVGDHGLLAGFIRSGEPLSFIDDLFYIGAAFNLADGHGFTNSYCPAIARPGQRSILRLHAAA
ncbi:MAG: hypothetical protein WDO13_05080 [Verrucomicrobiota bacterium]